MQRLLCHSDMMKLWVPKRGGRSLWVDGLLGSHQRDKVLPKLSPVQGCMGLSGRLSHLGCGQHLVDDALHNLEAGHRLPTQDRQDHHV